MVITDVVRGTLSFLVRNAINQLLSKQISLLLIVTALAPTYIDMLNLVVSALEHHPSLLFSKDLLRFLSMLSLADPTLMKHTQEDTF